MRTPFSERAAMMGLECNYSKGFYLYSDQYSSVIYRQLATMNDEPQHETDDQLVPIMAIFTKGPEQVSYTYKGYVSNFYQFMGNDMLNKNIRSSIQGIGTPILTEETFINFDFTRMRSEFIIQSSKNVPVAGDIAPVLITQNSYDGTKAASLSFGISTYVNSNRVVFGFSLGEMKQIHIVNSNTEMTSAIASYMEVFSTNISDMILRSFNTPVTEDQMLGTLDVIEKLGKRRREEISKILEEIPPLETKDGVAIHSAWGVFLSIVRYSSFEPNINVKKILENIAESVLVIPTRMYEVLNKLQNQ